MEKINELLDKYWEGETSLEEERELKNLILADDSLEFEELKVMFSFFENESEIEYKGQFKPKKTRVIFHNFRKNIAVAASILLLIFSGISILSTISRSSKSLIARSEISNPDEALKITEEALSLLAINYNKGEKSVRENLKNLEKLDIIKIN